MELLIRKWPLPREHYIYFFPMSFKNIVLQMNEAVGHFKSDSGDTLSFCTRARTNLCVHHPHPHTRKRGAEESATYFQMIAFVML